MAELFLVGLRPSAGSDTENLTNARTQINSGISRVTVAGRVRDSISGAATGDPNSAYVTKTYVEQRDALFTSVEYYTTQDALLTPVNAKPVGNGTAPNGVASLVGGKIPTSQVPVLGVGIFKGPFPVVNAYTGNTFDIPLKIAEFEIGEVGIACVPWVFMSVSVQSDGGLPVVEVRAGDPSQTTYASQTLVAQGYGRSYYYDWQTVAVLPTDPDINEGQDVVEPGQYVKHDSYPVLYDMVLTAWVYDDAQGVPHQKVQTDSKFISGSAYLVKMRH